MNSLDKMEDYDKLLKENTELTATIADWERRSESCESKLGQLEAVEELQLMNERNAELERKLAEQQAIVANFFSMYGVDVTDRGLNELNNLLAKAKEEGRRESFDIVINYDKAHRICDEYKLDYNKFCAALRAMLSAAPKPEGTPEIETFGEVEESYNCPIHGNLGGSDCPRC